MFDQLQGVVLRYNELTELMATSDVLGNLALLQQYAREQREIEPLVAAFHTYQQTMHAIEETQLLLNDGLDAELRELAQEELATLRTRRTELEESMKLLLLPSDPNDEKDVIIEIRQGEGGDEAALFAGDLYRMYYRYVEECKWKLEIVSMTENGGGIKEIIFEIHGEGVYSRMKYEGGVHRVQRVPATEARGRIHTSTATVAVLPEIAPTDVTLRDEDWRIDTFRSGGHGGQGVNTTDSAVRIVYKGGTPDEIVVTCQDGRSQIKNRDKALTVLRARMYAREQEKRQRSIGDSRLAQVGTGERAEKVRTYNFPQDRVTDHRIGQSFSNLPGMLDGNLDRLIDALTVYDNAERLKSAGLN